jgi:hypothetical protein
MFSACSDVTCIDSTDQRYDPPDAVLAGHSDGQAHIICPINKTHYKHCSNITAVYEKLLRESQNHRIISQYYSMFQK